MRYIIFLLVSGVIVLSAIAYSLVEKKRILSAELGDAKANYELVKAHLEYQNKTINEAHETLKSYHGKIAQIEKEYNLKLTAYEKQIAKIKTCDDGFKYLKNMLDDLKGIQ